MNEVPIMEWSSDDEDIPPVASLRLSGSTASPCFLVQDSQPSPKKQIAGSFAGGFLHGLSQVKWVLRNTDDNFKINEGRESHLKYLKCCISSI